MESVSAIRIRAGGLAALALLLTTLAAACDRSPAAPGASTVPDASGPRGTPQGFACAAVLEMTPAEAGDYLEARGYEVGWRWETTINENEGYSEVVTEPSEGVILDVAENDGQAIVFVSPSDDPAVDRPNQTGCTEDDS